MRAGGQFLAGDRLLAPSRPHARARHRGPALRGRARHRARRPQPRAEIPRAVVPGRYFHRLARHHRRHDGQQFLRRPLAALRHHARQRARDRRGARRRHVRAFRPDRLGSLRRAGRIARSRPRSPCARRPRGARDRGPVPESAAPGRRLQPRCAAFQCAEPCASPGRLGRHARVLDPHRAEAVAAARAPRGRRLSFRRLPPGDGCRPAYRKTRPDRGRARRPHHDRARARHRHVPPDAGALRARRARGDLAGRVRRGRFRGKPAPAGAPARTHGRSRVRLGPGRRALWRRGRRARIRPADRDRRSAHLRPQRDDVDEGGRQAGVVRRGLRGAARASRRIYRTPHPALRAPRHPWHLVRPRFRRLPARAPGAQPAARQGREGDARHCRRSLRDGARLQGLAFGRARRRHRPLRVPRTNVRAAAGARVRGGQGPLRSHGAVQSGKNRARAEIRRPPAVPLRPRVPRRGAFDCARLVGIPGRERRIVGRGRDVQQQRRLAPCARASASPARSAT